MVIFQEVRTEVEVPGLADRIKRAIADSGMSMEKVCERVDFSRQHLHKVLAGDRPLSIEHLRSLERVLDCDFRVKFDSMSYWE